MLLVTISDLNLKIHSRLLMKQLLDTQRWVKVVCEHCAGDKDPACVICLGRRFYLWDPTTFLCYSSDGEPLFAPSGDGEYLQIVRRATIPSQGDANYLTLEDMLTFLGEWASQDKKRRFKLWFEEGWNCYVWPNRYRAGIIAASHANLRSCVDECYRKVVKGSGRMA